MTQHDCGAELYIDRGKDSGPENKSIFDQLLARREQIDAAFGGALSWERLEEGRASRIRARVSSGGYRSSDEAWETIQAEQADAMNRLHRALQPHLKSLKLGYEVPE